MLRAYARWKKNAGLLLCDIHLHTAQRIDHIDQAGKTYRHKLLDIQIQIRIQHADRLLRAAACVGRVTLIVFIISQVHKGISVYRNQLDFLRILVDGSDDDRIASGILCQRPHRGVHTEQCNIPVSFHDLQLFFTDTLVDDDLLLRNLQISNFLRPGYSPQHKQHNRKQQNFPDKKQNTFSLFLSPGFCRHFLFGTAFRRRFLPRTVPFSTGRRFLRWFLILIAIIIFKIVFVLISWCHRSFILSHFTVLC